MSTSRAVLRRKDTTPSAALYMSFDLGDKQWHLSLGDGRSGVSRYTVAAGDTMAVADRIVKAAARFKQTLADVCSAKTDSRYRLSR